MTDLIAYYDFETDSAGQAPSSWLTGASWFINTGATPTVVNSTAFTGNQCLQIVTPASPNLTGAYVPLGTLPAGTYHVGVYCKGNVGGESVGLFGGQGNATWNVSNITLTTTWTRYKFTFTTDGTAACVFGARTNIVSQKLFIDAVQIVSGPALPGYILFGWNGGTDVVDLPIGVTETDIAARYVWETNNANPRALTNVTQTQRNAATAFLNNAHTNKPQSFDLTFHCANGYQGLVSIYCVDWDDLNRAQTVRINGVTHTLTNFSSGHWIQEAVNVPPNGQLPISVQPIDPNTTNAVVSGVFFGGVDNQGWQPINTVNHGDAAQGDLSGTYPSPTVTKVLGGQTPISASTALGGELSGTLPNPTLATSRTTLTGIAQNTNFAAVAGKINYCTGAIIGTLPSAPAADAEVGIMSLTATVTVNRGGTDTLGQYGITALTSISVPVGTTVVLKYLAGVWYLVRDSRPVGWNTAARAYRNAALNLNANTETKIAVDAVSFDPYGRFDITTNFRYNVPYPGDYQVNGAIGAGPTSAGIAAVLYKTGVEMAWGVRMPAVTTQIITATIGEIIPCVAGDYLELWGWSGSGSAVAVGVGSINGSWLSVARIG